VFSYLFSFKGRINRAKMWLFLVVQVVWTAFWFVTQPLVGRLVAAYLPSPAAMRYGAMAYLLAPLLYVFIAVFVKRLHDRSKSWWWFLGLFVLPMALIPVGYMLSGYAFVGFIPGLPAWTPVSDTHWEFLGFLLLGAGLLVYLWYFIELFCLRGTAGENRFGPDPLTSKT
jgi:uncharacterized membrane protein YhaH (DUF805 family)